MIASRTQSLCELYGRVFSGEEDRIPLMVTPTCPPGPSREELVTDTAAAVVRAAESKAPKVAAETDWLPSVCIAWYQNTAVPSAFGAGVAPVEGAFPIARPVFRTVDEAAAAGKPDLDTQVISEMLQTVETAVRSLPEGFFLSFPATVSPLDLAQLLVPAEEFFVALLAEPEAAGTFLLNLTDMCIEVQRMVDERLPAPVAGHLTCRGMYFPGLRLPCDSIVNLSPAAIREFVLPVLERFGPVFGQLCLHVCTAPAPAGHVLPVLLEFEAVAAVDNWQGPDVFIGDDAPASEQSQIAIITDVDLSGEAEMDAFLSRAPVRDVPRQGGRGLAVHTRADSVDEARRIYASWRERVG
jgi:hypothetical protein